MPGRKMKSVKKPKTYEALRKRRGMSKERAAKIANAQARRQRRRRRR